MNIVIGLFHTLYRVVSFLEWKLSPKSLFIILSYASNKFYISYFIFFSRPRAPRAQTTGTLLLQYRVKKCIYLMEILFISHLSKVETVETTSQKNWVEKAALELQVTRLFHDFSPKHTHGRHIKTLQKKLRNKIYRISSSKVIIWKSDTA